MDGELTGPLDGELTEPLEGELSGPLDDRLTGPLDGPLTEPLDGELTGPLAGRLTETLEGPPTGPLRGASPRPFAGPPVRAPGAAREALTVEPLLRCWPGRSGLEAGSWAWGPAARMPGVGPSDRAATCTGPGGAGDGASGALEREIPRCGLGYLGSRQLVQLSQLWLCLSLPDPPPSPIPGVPGAALAFGPHPHNTSASFLKPSSGQNGGARPVGPGGAWPFDSCQRAR